MRVPITLIIALLLPLVAASTTHGAHLATPAQSHADPSGIAPLPLTGERRAAVEDAAPRRRFGATFGPFVYAFTAGSLAW